jgi:hypothetical protein
MDDTFATIFARIRRIVLICFFVFFVAAVALFADCYYLSRASPPGFLATYAFAVLFGFVLGTLPVMSYLIARALRTSTSANLCPYCHRPLWWHLDWAFTAAFRRCPACFRLLKTSRGFPVIPPVTGDLD